jgi:tRNA(Arg) A34 adenosine deaminase TadA
MNRDLMSRTIDLSLRAMQADFGGPFAALVVRDGTIIAEGCNRVTSDFDPTAHAEVVAIRAACRELGTFSLAGCEIYASCEPCPMCLAAIYWARLDRVYYGNSREDAAAIGFDDAYIYEEVARPIGERQIDMVQLMRPQAQAAFAEWLRKDNRIEY